MASLKFKMEYVRQVYDRYHKVSKTIKAKILDELCKVCRWHRKHAIRVLSRPRPDRHPGPRHRAGVLKYHARTIPILAAIWKAAGYLCSQRLKAALPLWIGWAKKRFAFGADVEAELLAISPRQMDRRLDSYKRKVKRRLYGTTKPGLLLKRMIPIRTDFWDVKKPGFTENDLVSHSGGSEQGDFAHTLNNTDIKTTWVARRAILGKSKAAVVDGMTHVEQTLPFPLLGIDSDNGSEFINDLLYAFCRERPQGQKIQFTRSRPYKKDDNAHVEQKNWTHVRKLIGYDRYDTPQAVTAMNQVFDVLDLFQNLFQPSMKLAKKVRIGSRLIRRYDKPRTPFQRVLECPEHDVAKVQKLQVILGCTDPFELSEKVDRQLNRLYTLAARPSPTPREKIPAKTSPWRQWQFSRKIKQRRKIIQRSKGFNFKTKPKGDKAR